MASYNLQEVAQLQYMQVQEDEGTPTWARFKDLLNLRFGRPPSSSFHLAAAPGQYNTTKIASRRCFLTSVVSTRPRGSNSSLGAPSAAQFAGADAEPANPSVCHDPRATV